MTPQERQLRILEFIERYQRDRRDAPTIREVVMGSGVSSYQDITGDIESLLQRRMVAWVAEAVSGSEPFSSRQVKSTRSPAAVAAAVAPPAQASRPPGPAASQRPAPPPIRAGAAPARPAPPPARHPVIRPSGMPRVDPSAGAPPGWGSAAPAPLGPSSASPAFPPAAQPPVDQRPPARSAVRQRPMVPAGNVTARSAGTLADSLGRWGLPWQLAIAAAAVAGLLLYLYLRAGAQLPLRPAISVRGQSIPMWASILVGVWGLTGLGLGLGLERRTWHWTDVTHGLFWGALGGLVYLVARILGLERLQGQASEFGLLLRLAGAALETLPVLLALRLAPFAGAAILAQAAALGINSLSPGGPAFWMLPILQAPVLALPGELAVLLPAMDRDRRCVMVGAALGALQQAVGAAFLPVGSWLSPLAGALAGAAMGWLLAKVGKVADGARDALARLLARLRSGNPGQGGHP
ncbi:MAG TPA: hypothetical protein PK826_01735 [Anaerolineae bacterium]|nr:hypothetical protein [Anaerolineae bacterium]